MSYYRLEIRKDILMAIRSNMVYTDRLLEYSYMHKIMEG